MGTPIFSLYNVLVLFGVLQGLLLISILLFNKNYRKKSNYALIVLLVFLTLMSFGNILEDLELYEIYPIVAYIPLYHALLMPAGLYYFVVFLMNPSYQFNKKDAWFFIPCIIHFIIIFGFLFSYLINPDFTEKYTEARFLFYRISELIMLIYWLWVIIFTIKKVNTYHQQLLANYSEIEGKNLFWLRNLMIINLILWGCIAITQTNVLLYRETSFLFYITLVCISLIIYWLGYFILLRRDIFEIPIFKSNSKEAYKPTLSDKTDEHYQKLLTLLEEKKLYQDAQLSMDTLAEKTDLSNGYLSKIINQKEGKNFYDFINSYRVKEVKARLNHPNYAHYSILGIALEAGFKSKSTFNAVFKKMTGMTPSAYKKSL